MEDFSNYFPIWSKLTAEQQTELNLSVLTQSYEKGSPIHSGSDDCIGLLVVKTGQIRVYTISEEGKELTLYRLLPRDMCLFSASCTMPNIQFDVMVSAAEDSTVFLVPAAVFKALMDNSVAMANYINELMASHFSEVMWLMDQILNKRMDSRLAAFLLEEGNFSPERDVVITHDLIAGHLGSMREVITRILRYFQSEGLVSLKRGRIRLLDIEKLEELARESLR
jgi:CRP/FNR family transcriptional regulator